MELIWVVGLLLVLAWMALAVVCVRKERTRWVVAAVLVPVPAAIVTLVVGGAIVRPQQTGGLDDFSRAYAAIAVAAGIAVLSSYAVLTIGAIAPRSKITQGAVTATGPIQYHTRLERRRSPAGDPGISELGPIFHDLDAARAWAVGLSPLHGESVVKIYTRDPTGKKLIETVEAAAQPVPDRADGIGGRTASSADDARVDDSGGWYCSDCEVFTDKPMSGHRGHYVRPAT